jgi:Flp pilus assembly protein CpaB
VVRLFSNVNWVLRRHRRLLAALLAAVAVWVGMATLEKDGTQVPVVVAAREIPGGTALSQDDLTLAWWPEQIAPDQAFDDVENIIGRTVAVTMSPRSPITGPALTESGKLVSEGMVALPVSFAAASELLKVGDYIDVIGPDSTTGAARVLASKVRVAAVWAAGSGVFSSGSDVVLIEVEPEAAATINSAASVSALSFALR